MLLHELRQAIVNFVPHFVRGDGGKFAARHFHGKIDAPLMSDLHDHRIGAAASRQKMRNEFDRLLRGGQARREPADDR